ncbi:MAG: RNA-directed DNA polymerase [Lachnospiraceae bacterium]|nr:RNA-directed DNA polymerase [Lachnospiraceae bacterium]
MTRYEEIACDANVLYEAYKASVKGSKWKDSSQKAMMNFLRLIFRIKDNLANRTLKNGPVEEFMQVERGRLRPITSIVLPDRVVRHVLCDNIFMPEIKKHIIYDNCASVKGRGISKQRKRFEVHLHKYYKIYGTNEGYIGFGDFSKFYDNIIHTIAKDQLLSLVDYDEFVAWLLDIVFEAFQIDVSYMTDEEYEHCLTDLFNKIEYRNIDKTLLTGEKYMNKSVNIGDQLSQIVGIYYPHPIDNYVKYVRSVKFYGRYMDDFYIMARTKEEIVELFEAIEVIAESLGIHINQQKTRIIKLSSTYKYLQIKYTLTADGKVIKRINPKRVTNMRRKLKSLQVKVLSGELPYENVEATFRSWMGSFYKLMSKQQRKNMLALYEELFAKKITVSQKKLIIIDNPDTEGGASDVEYLKAA